MLDVAVDAGGGRDTQPPRIPKCAVRRARGGHRRGRHRLDGREDVAAIILTGTDRPSAPDSICANSPPSCGPSNSNARRPRWLTSDSSRSTRPRHRRDQRRRGDRRARAGVGLRFPHRIRAGPIRRHPRPGRAMPGGGLTIRLPELIGPNRARQMSFTGDFVGHTWPTNGGW